MPVLSAHNISKAYGERTLLRDASVTIRTGERVGLVGKNGTGKSTFARILAGVEPKDGGDIAVRKGATVLYLEQMPDLPRDKTPRELVSEGLAAWSAAKSAYDAVSTRLATGPRVVRPRRATTTRPRSKIRRASPPRSSGSAAGSATTR